MRLKMPPVLQVAFSALLMWGINTVSDWSVSFYGQDLLAFGIILAGLLIALAGIWLFRISGTTVDPRFPTHSSLIVTDGIYRVTRNPMYLGMVIGLLGFAVWFGNPLNMLVLIAFVFWMTRFQIIPEEQLLRSQFGQHYVSYLDRVRRWI